MLVRRGLVHVRAAVDVDRLAGDEVAVVGGEEDDGADEVLGLLIALEGAFFSAVGELLGRESAFLLRARDRKPGRDRVDADVVWAQLARERAREADHAGLRRHVVKIEGRAAERRAG